MMRADFTSQAYFRNPAAEIEKLRFAGPVLEVQFPMIGKIWTTTTQELAARVLKDSETFTIRSSAGGVAGLQWWMPRILGTLANHMLSKDEPDHRRLRDIVDEAFRRRAVLEMEPRILAPKRSDRARHPALAHHREKKLVGEPNAAATRWRISPHRRSTRLSTPWIGSSGWWSCGAHAGVNRIPGFWRHAMRRVISLYLPHWPTDRLRRANKEFAARDKPLVTAMVHGQRRVLASTDQAARRLGLKASMTVMHAQSLIPELTVVNAAPEEDEAALIRLALWCIKCSPTVTADPPDGVFLDVAGSAHLFQGETALIGDLCRLLNCEGIAAKAALADTAGCAWALARFGETEIVSPGRASEAIASFPVAALRLAPESRHRACGATRRQTARQACGFALARMCSCGSTKRAVHRPALEQCCGFVLPANRRCRGLKRRRHNSCRCTAN
jgi:hypothetical protein